MSEEIQNAGGKARLLAGLFIFFILFISTWAYVYYSNANMEFPY